MSLGAEHDVGVLRGKTPVLITAGHFLQHLNVTLILHSICYMTLQVFSGCFVNALLSSVIST